MNIDYAFEVAINNTDSLPVNLAAYSVKFMVGAATAVGLSRITNLSLTRLAAGTLGGTAITVLPIGVAMVLPGRTNEQGQPIDKCGYPVTPRNGRQQGESNLQLLLGASSVVPAVVVGGAQAAMLTMAAGRIWNGAFRGLSKVAKVGVPLMLAVGALDVAVLRGYRAGYTSSTDKI